MTNVLNQWLETKFVAKKVIVIEKTDSTNNYAKQLLLEDKLDSGTVIIAKTQTGGRGQKNHNWESPEGGLYFTCLIDAKADSRVTILTLAMGLACHEAINKLLNINTRLKWVNDILYDNKKLGGLLLESKIRGNDAHLILGVGINVNNKLDTLSDNIRNNSTSLVEHAGHEVNIYQLAALLSNNIEHFLNLYLEGQDKLIKSLWIKNSDTIGRNVSFTIDGALKEGLIVGINEFGALIIQSDEGKQYCLVDNEGIVYK